MAIFKFLELAILHISSIFFYDPNVDLTASPIEKERNLESWFLNWTRDSRGEAKGLRKMKRSTKDASNLRVIYGLQVFKTICVLTRTFVQARGVGNEPAAQHQKSTFS